MKTYYVWQVLGAEISCCVLSLRATSADEDLLWSVLYRSDHYLCSYLRCTKHVSGKYFDSTLSRPRPSRPRQILYEINQIFAYGAIGYARPSRQGKCRQLPPISSPADPDSPLRVILNRVRATPTKPACPTFDVPHATLRSSGGVETDLPRRDPSAGLVTRHRPLGKVFRNACIRHLNLRQQHRQLRQGSSGCCR